MNRLTFAAGLLFLGTRLAGFASGALDQWQWRNPVPIGNLLTAITYANGTFAAVGDSGEVAASQDGTNWASQSLGPVYGVGLAYGAEGIAWGNGVWVLVGFGNYNDVGPYGISDFGVIMTSPDLITWTPRAAPQSASDLSLLGIAYANGLFVAVGCAYDAVWGTNYGAILTSPDGVHWTLQDSGTSDTNLKKVIYGNGLFVAVCSDGRILTSRNGVSWTAQQAYSGGDVGFDCATYWNGMYLTGCSVGILASTDGATWTNWVSSVPVKAIACSDGLLVAVGYNNSVQTSTNGLKWTQRGTVAPDGILDLSYGNGRFVAVGEGALAVSTNGVDWDDLGSAVTTTVLDDVAYGQGTFVAVGDGGVILRSADGVRWSVSASSWGRVLFMTAVAYDGGVFVAGGDSGTILASTDGLDWLAATNAGDTQVQDFAYGAGKFVAVGTQGVILTSANGSTWAPQNAGLTANLRGAAYGNGLFVVGTGSGFLTSTDAVAWTEQDLTVPGANVAGLGYGNGLFVAVGSGGLILTSTDAVDWVTSASGTTADLNRVAYGDGTFLITGWSGTLLTSTSGADWVSRNSGTMSTLRGAAFGQGTFVVVGDFGAILQSGVLPSLGARLTPVPGWTDGVFGLSLSASLGGQWEVQASTNLLNWTPLGTITITNAVMPFTDTGAANFHQRFYRAVSR
jgi:hypothetical protein